MKQPSQREEARIGNDPVAAPRVTCPNDGSYLPSDWTILASRWFAVARIEDIADRPVKARLLDIDLVLYRTSRGIHAARDLCPHRGVPLSMGWVEREELICPYHGLRFGTDGRCLRIPAQPSVTPSERFRARMFPVVERYGLVWTSLNGSPEGSDIPPFPEWDDPAYFAVANPPVDIAAAPARQIEGFIDVAHFAWIHHKSFADRQNQIVPVYKVRHTEYGMSSEYISTVGNLPRHLTHTSPAGFKWLRRFDVYPPFIAILTVDFPSGGILRILNVASPVSARKTRLLVPVARNFDTDGRIEDVHAFNAGIFAEDQAIIEAQRPQDLPLDLDLEAHFAADKASVRYRKLLKEMGLALTARRPL